MKKALLTLLLIMSCLFCNAQLANKSYNPYEINELQSVNYYTPEFKYQKQDRVNNLKVVGMMAGSIVLEAIGDASYDQGKDDGNRNQMILGKTLQAGSVGTLLMIPFVADLDRSKWWLYGLKYTGIRIALFDPAYNLTRDLPINYIGNVSIWDSTLQQFAPEGGLLFARGVFIIFGFKIPI